MIDDILIKKLEEVIKDSEDKQDSTKLGSFKDGVYQGKIELAYYLIEMLKSI